MAPGQDQTSQPEDKPRCFFPASKPSETAPAHERLRYVHALATPPRWHLESELAYAWAGIGSLVSALEIFKRLRLWAEVALCLASTSISDDEQGRGKGGEEKARGIIRWRLFNLTDSTISVAADDEKIEDVTRIKPADFCGPERSLQPNAPRLFCILGELENAPELYERAWEVSNKRYSRAQKSLGEHYLQQKDWVAAKEAYKKAVSVNRLSSELWSRLGDIHLRLGEFEDAAEAFGRAIAAADNVVGGEDARTWSNLGSALWSLYLETIEELKKAKTNGDSVELEDDDENPNHDPKQNTRDPSKLIYQSLTAYKRGAGIARENWRIWDNVLTIASRTRPPSITDMVHALQNIIRIRQTEDALDEDLLRALLQDAVLAKEKPSSSKWIYEAPRGSIERAVILLFESQIQPLITKRSDLWALLSQLNMWKRDYAAAVGSAEKAWRCATTAGGGGLLPSAGVTTDWTKDAEAWKEVVRRTDELVSVLETFGPQVETVGEKWKGKARSAVRSVMSKGKERWEGGEEWKHLEVLMEGLKR
jgi:tetratricopeptide (TPR) repeat protein